MKIRIRFEPGQEEMETEVAGHIDIGMALTLDDLGRIARFNFGSGDTVIGWAMESNHPSGCLVIWDEVPV